MLVLSRHHEGTLMRAECEGDLRAPIIPAMQDNTVLVMDYMEKGALSEVLAQQDSRGNRVFQFRHKGSRVACDIALGLVYLHSRK